MSNLYKQDYDQLKASVLDYLDRSAQQLRGWGKEDVADDLVKLGKQVSEGLFSIVLVGEFSKGKSTFLNALMHKRILPSFLRETTATVIFLRHADQAPDGISGRVFYNDGTTRDLYDLGRDTLEKLVSTKGNSGDVTVAATVDHVDLYLDSDFLQNGVMLVDSPGLNGIQEGHRQLTERQIQASHACVFMFSAEQPGSLSEFETIRQLRQNSNNIFFVLNKIGKINPAEGETVESVTESVVQNYRRQFPEAGDIPKIWPIDSYDALVARDPEEKPEAYKNREEYERRSRFSDFENRLWKYLTKGERTRDQLVMPVEKALKEIGAECRKLNKQLEILKAQHSSEQLQRQKELLEKEIAVQEATPIASTNDLKKQVSDVVERLKDSLPRHRNEIMDLARQQFDYCETVTDLKNALHTINLTINRKLESLSNGVDVKLKDELMGIIETEYSQCFAELEERIQSQTEDNAFHFDFEPLASFDGSINVDLEALRAKQDALEAQISDLENNRDDVELRKIQVRRIERDIQDKKSELANLKSSYRYIQYNFQAPSTVSRTEAEEYTYHRGGIIGGLGDLLFGKKRGTRYVTVNDTTARDEACQEKKEQMESIGAEIAAAEQEIRVSVQPTENSDELELKYSRLQEKLNQSREELARLLVDGQAEIKQKSDKAMRRHKDEIMSALSEVLSAFTDQADAHLNKQRRAYCVVVQEVLSSTYNHTLQTLREQYNEVIRNMQLEDAERSNRIREAEEALANAAGLINAGSELIATLEMEMSDQIETEVFADIRQREGALV